MVVSSLGLVVRDIHMIMNERILGMIILFVANIATDKFPWVLRLLSGAMPVTRGIEGLRMVYAKGDLTKVYSFYDRNSYWVCSICFLATFFIEYLSTWPENMHP